MYVAILGQIDDRCENKLFVKVKNGIGVSVQPQAHSSLGIASINVKVVSRWGLIRISTTSIRLH